MKPVKRRPQTQEVKLNEMTEKYAADEGAMQKPKNEEEIGSLPEKEFRLMIVRMIKNPGNRMEKV